MEGAPGVRGQAPEAARPGPAAGGRHDPRRVPAGRRASAEGRQRGRRRDAGAALAVGRHERAVGADGRRQVRRPRAAGADEQTERRVRHGRRAAQPAAVDTTLGAGRDRLLAHHAHQPAALLAHIREPFLRTVEIFFCFLPFSGRRRGLHRTVFCKWSFWHLIMAPRLKCFFFFLKFRFLFGPKTEKR